jgi:ribosome-binding ATPase YchF (GTP1/OBG family)
MSCVGCVRTSQLVCMNCMYASMHVYTVCLNALVKAAYELRGLRTYFTTGMHELHTNAHTHAHKRTHTCIHTRPPTETRAWTIVAGTKAPHTYMHTYIHTHMHTCIYTGPTETRAWTIVAGTKAPQAAGVIHQVRTCIFLY